MTAQDIINYAAASAQLVDTCRSTIRKLASEVKQLKQLKQNNAAPAPAPAPALDEALLMKAANDMHTIYGKPSNVTPEQIASYWRSNPNTMLSTMAKLASANLERVVAGEHIGTTRQEPQRKKATADAPQDATMKFWGKYNQ